MRNVRRFLDGMETLLFSSAPDMLSQLEREFVDMPALVTYMLLVELTKNPDGYRGSTFMHKVCAEYVNVQAKT